MHRRLYRLVLAALLAIGLSGCGLLDPAGEVENPVVGNPADLEKTVIKVAVLTTLDTAPLRLGIQEGLFQDEGLSIELVEATSGSDAVTLMIGGDVDVAFGSYTPFFLAESNGVASGSGGVKVVADAAALADGNSKIVVAAGSPIQNLRELAGKRIAIVAPNTMTQMLVAAALDLHDIDPNLDGADPHGIQWIPLKFNETAAALTQGHVDAAFLTEPFLTDAEINIGAISIYDTDDGYVSAIPLTGYAATGSFVQSNPDTLKAFQRAMQRATALAIVETGKIRELVQDYAKVKPLTAELMGYTEFVSSLDPLRIQRTADLMHQFGILKSKLDVTTMIVPPAPTTSGG